MVHAPPSADVLAAIPSVKAQPTEPTADTKKTGNDNRGTKDNPLVVHIKGSEPSDQESAENKAKTAHDEAIKNREINLTIAIAVATGCQALFACLQWIVYKKQSDLMDRSLAETKKSADAALLNANALIGAERAWVLITHNAGPGGDTWMFQFEGKNHGKSPAEILYSGLEYEALEFNDSLPEIPPYVDGPTAVFTHRQWLPPGAFAFDTGHFSAHAVYGQYLKETFADLKSGKKRLWLYGVIRYRDAISPDIHETRFCYWKNPNQGVNLMMGGPPGYNQCT